MDMLTIGEERKLTIIHPTKKSEFWIWIKTLVEYEQ